MKRLIKSVAVVLILFVINTNICSSSCLDKTPILDEIIKKADEIVPGTEKQWNKEKARREELKEMFTYQKRKNWYDNSEKREEENESLEYEKEELDRKYKNGELSVIQYLDSVKKINDRCNNIRYEKNKEWIKKNDLDKKSLEVFQDEMNKALESLIYGIKSDNKKEVRKSFNTLLEMYKGTNDILEKKIKYAN